MANYEFDKINYENDYYYPRDTRCFLVKGTQNSVTNMWTGVLPNGMSNYPTSIEEAFSIDYYLPYDSNNKGVTLNLSNKGAKKVYLNNSNEQVTNQFLAGSVVRMTYIPTLDNMAGAWKMSTYYVDPMKEYYAGTALSLQNYTFNHNDYMDSDGTIGTRQSTSGGIIDIPYVSYNKQGHVVGGGIRTHTVTYPSVQHKQDGVDGNIVTHYAECSTPRNIADKVATILYGRPYLEEGLRVAIKFTEANTASNPSLNLNGLGAKPIYLNGSKIIDFPNILALHNVVELIYDGSIWHIVGDTLDLKVQNDPNANVKFYVAGPMKSEGSVDIQFFDTGVYVGENPGELYAVGDYHLGIDSSLEAEIIRLGWDNIIEN